MKEIKKQRAINSIVWIYFLKNSKIKDEFKAKGLAEAREKLKEINLPPEELGAYRRYLEQLHYEASIAETIKFDAEFDKREAREEGREEGRENKARETAVLIIQDGEPLEKISKYTGLSIEEISRLKPGE